MWLSKDSHIFLYITINKRELTYLKIATIGYISYIIGIDELDCELWEALIWKAL